MLDQENASLTHEEEEIKDEVSQIEIDIAELEAKILLRKHVIRNEVYGLIATIIVGLICIYIFIANLIGFVNYFNYPNLPNPYSGYAFLGIVMILLVVASFIGSIALVAVIATEQWKITNIKTEIDRLLVRKKIAKQFREGSEKSTEQVSSSYFDSLVRINVENLGEYYTLVKAHTQKSFTVSIIAGIIGFTLIIIGLSAGFINVAHIQVVSYIASGSGVITEFIAGVFFYLYNRTVRQLKEYHDSLLAVQNILLSFKIVGDTQDESEKVKMVSQMLAYLVGKQNVPNAGHGQHSQPA